VARRSSSNRWLQRQSADPYVKQREQDGYRSRAAYKLLEINKREKLLRPGSRVLDLGSAPGGWTQVAVELAGARGTVVAVDVLKMNAVAGATFVQGDCRDTVILESVEAMLGGTGVDLVMSDMAPNISGIAAQDEAAATELALMAVTFACSFLRPAGALVMKLFQSAETDAVIDEIFRHFASVARRKPDASRSRSRELYVVAKRFGL
jgi:23S rRNA (uridine2552-2'-O)-methyltransferase